MGYCFMVWVYFMVDYKDLGVYFCIVYIMVY